MSKTVDERVVSMQFDNKKFEQNVQTTMKTLERLKSKLNLKGAAKGLEDVDKATKKLDMTPLTNGIHTVGLKFSALQVAATTALANIANSAVNAGKRLISAFTIDPIKTGLQEYETQINAVQTILANTQSKGTTLDQVNTALDELNRYADMTIYNFTEMTRNIGTFTAAGVDLDTSVSAIKGIANLAAVSGSTSQQASNAMYQLSQALSSGTVKLMDWNSVVNAGMGGQVFQDALKETARVHGIAIDDMIKDEGSFRETLQHGWLTSAILTETLSKFTGDLSEEQLKSMGYTEEQIKEIIKLGKTANDAATKVKTFTQLMDTLKEAAQSGWTQTWEILIGDFEEAKALWTSVSDVFSEIINSSAEARNSMLQAWADAGGRDMIIDSLKNAFKALLSVINPIKEAFREIFPATTSNQLLKITENIKKFTENLILSEEAQAKVKSTFKGFFAVIDIGVTIIKEVISGLAKLIGKLAGIGGEFVHVTGAIGDWLSYLRDSIKESGFFAKVIGTITNALSFLLGKIKVVVGFLSQNIIAPGFEGLLKLFQGLGKILGLIGDKIKSVILSIGEALGNAFRGGDMNTAMDLLNGGIIASILLGIKKFVGGFTKSIKDITSITSKVTGILDSVKGCFEAYQKDLKANTLLKIAAAIAILASAIVIIASIYPGRLTASLGAVTVLFGNLMGSLAIFNKIGLLQKGIIKASAAMILMSVAVLILAAALKNVASIDADNLFKGIIGIAVLTGMLIGVSKLMSKNTTSFVKAATSLIIFATAINILAVACEKLAGIDTEGLKKGLIAIAVMMAEIVVFLKLIPGKVPNMAMSLLGLATALMIMSLALVKMGRMSWEQVAKGLVALGGSMLILAAGLKVMKGTLAGSAALILAAVALGMLVPSMLILGKMSWENLAKGLMVMAVSLALLGVAAYAFKPVVAIMAALTGILSLLGLSMIILGTGLAAIAAAFKITDAGTIAKGLMAIGGAMIVFGASVLIPALMSPLIMLLGSALLILGKGLVAVGLAFAIMDFGTMAKGLMALGGAFTVFVLAALPAILLSPLLLIFAGAMLLLGNGVLKLALGLTALAAAFSVSGVLIVNAIKTIFTTIIGLIPSFIEAIGKGIILICKTISNSVVEITYAIASIIVAVMNALDRSIPKIVSVVFKLLDALLSKLVEYTPTIVAAVFNILVACLDGIASGLPKVVESAVTIVTNFINGVSQQLPRVVQAGWDLIINFIDGLTNSINTNTPRLIASIKNLFKAVLNAAVTVLTGGVVDLEASGGNLIEGFKKGIKTKLSTLWDKVKGGFEKFKNKVADFFGIHSPSKVFAEFGQYLDEGLIVGLNKYSGKVSNSAESVGNDAIKSMSSALSGISLAVDSDIDSQPSIRPVLDLSNIESGAGTIGDLLSMEPSVGVLANVGSISSLMNKRQNGGTLDILSAIESLGNKLGNGSSNVYNVNGITYDDGSNVAEAIGALIRAAKIERRI